MKFKIKMMTELHVRQSQAADVNPPQKAEERSIAAITIILRISNLPILPQTHKAMVVTPICRDSVTNRKYQIYSPTGCSDDPSHASIIPTMGSSTARPSRHSYSTSSAVTTRTRYTAYDGRRQRLPLRSPSGWTRACYRQSLW